MEPEEIEEVLNRYLVNAAYGGAVLQAHQLENSLVLLLATKLVDRHGENTPAFDEAHQKLQKLTLGKLINRVENECGFSEYWLGELDNMLYFRNELIHNISWQIRTSHMEPEGEQWLIEHLEEVKGYFKETNQEIMRHIFLWFEEHGIPKEKLVEVAEKWVAASKEARKA